MLQLCPLQRVHPQTFAARARTAFGFFGSKNGKCLDLFACGGVYGRKSGRIHIVSQGRIYLAITKYGLANRIDAKNDKRS
jgi:hypothetical protein